jgi:hypothetical protein
MVSVDTPTRSASSPILIAAANLGALRMSRGGSARGRDAWLGLQVGLEAAELAAE